MAVKTLSSVLITFLALCVVNSSTTKVWNNQDLKKEVVEKYSNVHLVPQCAKKCALLKKCKTFAFLQEKNSCYLYDEKPNGNNLVKKNGSKLYTLDDFDLVQVINFI